MQYDVDHETIEKHEKEDSMMAIFLERGVITKIKRVFKTSASVFFILIMSMLMVSSLMLEDAYGATDRETKAWAIIVGDEELTYVASEDDGEKVIEGMEDYYLTKKATLLDVEFSPAVSVKLVECVPRGAKIKSVKQAVKYLCLGEMVKKTYKAKKNETLTSIAKKKGLSAKKLVELNDQKYGQKEKLKKGTKVKVYDYDPYVDVKTVEKIKTTEKISYKTVYRKTKKYKYGVLKVDTKGKKGEKIVVRKIVKLNGEKTSSRILSSKRLKKATNKVVLKGTANVTAKKGKTFDFKTGEQVVKYAKKFVGNPYKYGGSSLTKGSDCSGFVYRVYKNMGVDLPRCDQDSVGKKVSYKNVKKGDILFYSGHVAIYAGNGKAIHAVNERLGIKVTDVNYTGKVLKVRRIFE